MSDTKKQKRKPKRPPSQNATESTSQSQTTKGGDEKTKEEAERQRKAELEIKIRNRVASEAKAFDIVNRLIEANITAEYLLEACRFIDHTHYEDVVEERSIAHLCGYPLCSNTLSQVSKKKYHISTKSNTVYDITERKMYCSNTCYHASKHLHKQIPPTPVWTRRDGDLTTFHLLQNDNKVAVEGDEVISFSMFGLKDEVLMLEKLDKKSQHTIKQTKPVTLEEGKRLSDQLLSLSKEEDLDSQLGSLSLSEKVDRDMDLRDQIGSKSPREKEESCTQKDTAVQKAHPSSGADEETTPRLSAEQDSLRESLSLGEKESCTQMGAKVDKARPSSGDEAEKTPCSLAEQDSLREKKICNDSLKPEEKIVKVVGSFPVESDSCAKLESALGGLTLQDNETRNAVDSDDDSDDDDAEQCDVAGSNNKASQSVSKTQDRGHSKSSTDLPPNSTESSSKAMKTDDRATHAETEKDASKASSKQQPGESKAAYLMRLLDKRKNLLSKVADIQADPTEKSQTAEVCSAEKVMEKSTTDNTKAKISINVDEHTLEGSPSDRGSSEDLSKTDKGALPLRISHSTPKVKLASEKQTSVTQARTSAKKSGKDVASSPQVSPINAICHIVGSWVSLETLSCLGLSGDQTQGDDIDQESHFHKDPEMQRKYQNLCQRLAGQEKDFDELLGEEEVRGEEEEGGGSRRKPLPHFEELKNQTEEFQLRVQQFLGGSSSSIKKLSDKGDGGEEADSAESKRPIVLPVIDSHNQLLIRRRIVLDRLDRSIPSLLPPIGLSVQDVSGTLRELVYTFSLTSHNIVFKPVEWTLVALILLKIANILLDKHMEAKIGDLGQAQQASGRDAGSTTARLTHITRAQATTKLYGTRAYQAREVQTGSQPSTKSDVFAMGVVLLEVFSGEQAYDERREGEQFLSDYFRSQKGESGNEACLSKIDRRGGECPAEVSLAILDIADVSTRHLKRHRPTSVELLQRMVQADELYRQKTGIKSLGMDSMPGSEHSCHLSHSSSPGGSVDNLAGAPHPTHHLSIAPQPGNGFSVNVNSDTPSEKHYAMHLHHDKKSNICMPDNTNTAAGLCRDTAVHQNCRASASSSHTPIEYFQDGQTPPPAFLLQQAYDSQTTAEKKRISRLSQCRTAADRAGHEEGGEVEVLPQADPAKLAALEHFDRMNLHGNCEEKESNSFQSDPQKLAALKQFDEQVHHQDAQQYVGGNEEQGDDLACDPKKLALLRQFDTVQARPAVHQDRTDQEEAMASDPRKLDALTRFDAANKENAVCSPTVNTQQLASQRALSDTAAEDMFPVSRVDYVVTSQREALEACSSMVQKKQEVDTDECTTSTPDTTWHTEPGLTAPSTPTQDPEAQPSSPDENLLCRRQNFFDLYSRALEGMDDDDEEDLSYGNDYDEGAEENNDDAARGWMAGSGVGHCSPSVQEQVCAPMLSGHCHPIPSEQDESVLGYFKQREQHYEKTFNKPQASPC